VIVVERTTTGCELLKRVQGTPFQRKLQIIVGDVLQVDGRPLMVHIKHPVPNFVSFGIQTIATRTVPM